MNKPLRCCSCNKVLADEVSITAGRIVHTCKCGTVNVVEAKPKEQIPYGERLQMVQKEGHKAEFVIPYNQLNTEGDVFMPGCFNKSLGKKKEAWGGDIIDTSKNAIS